MNTYKNTNIMMKQGNCTHVLPLGVTFAAIVYKDKVKQHCTTFPPCWKF